jgi:alpha-amylase
LPVADEYDVPEPISWADEERDLSAWLENKMQQEAIKRLYALETAVLESKDEQLIETWGRLQTSDHFYYMSTKYQNDGKVHAYFSPYDSPFDAYINFMNVLSDFEQRLAKKVALQA